MMISGFGLQRRREFGAGVAVGPSMDPGVQALVDRIAAVRTAIEDEKRARTAVEENQLLAEEDPTESALEALREEVTAARAKLTKLQRQTPEKRGPVMVSGERAERNGCYFVGAMLAAPGLFIVLALLRECVLHPEDAFNPLMMLVLAAPLLLGLSQLGRARFAKYDAKHDALGWDFLG